MKESHTQRQILDYLTLKGIFHYRNDSGPFIDAHQKEFERNLVVAGGKYILAHSLDDVMRLL